MRNASINAGFDRSPSWTSTAKAHFPLFRSIHVLGLALLGSLLGAVSASASEPILTLATVNYASFPIHSLPVIQEFATASTIANSSSDQQAAVEPVRSFTEDSRMLSINVTLQKPLPTFRNPLALARKHPRATAWSSAILQAGFGEIFCDKTASIYGRNGTGWEEPACGYLKVHFTF